MTTVLKNIAIVCDTRLWSRASSPHCTDGAAEAPRGGGAAGDRESEGELGSSLALPAVAGTNSLHFLLILVPQEAWALGRRAPREDPSCACRPATSPCCLTWPTEPTPTPATSPKSSRPVVELGFCLRYVLMSPEGTTRRPLPSDPQCPLVWNTIET